MAGRGESVTVKAARDLPADSPARYFAGKKGYVAGVFDLGGVGALIVRFVRYVPGGKADYLPAAYKRPMYVYLYPEEVL